MYHLCTTRKSTLYDGFFVTEFPHERDFFRITKKTSLKILKFRPFVHTFSWWFINSSDENPPPKIQNYS